MNLAIKSSPLSLNLKVNISCYQIVDESSRVLISPTADCLNRVVTCPVRSDCAA
ncbi:hypothetical protein J6590_054587 [Homalodisca vitripennis]|nr:hypothetical protein J6590_054587 [Homalodisca vitripennis]